jgi:hypothetical protein
MADSSEIRSGLAAFLQKKASKRLKNTLFNVMPTLEFLFALAGDKDGADGLGRPKTGIVLSQLGVAKAQTQKLMAERVYLPTIQTTKPSVTDIKAMADYDNDPTVPAWETTNAPLSRITQPRFKFVRHKMPYKVPHSEVRTAQNSARTEGEVVAAIRSVYDLEVKSRMAVLCESFNQMLWGTHATYTNDAPTDEDAVQWDCLHSLEKALSASNVYGGVDRSLSANSWWRGNYITASNSQSWEDRINDCNYDLGFAAKGMGVQLIAVGGTLFKSAKAEAKSEGYQLFSNGIPEYPEFGFKREVVRIFSGNRPVYIVYDPEVPANHGAFLDPSTWTVAIHSDSNFKISTPADQTKVEGGDEADTGTIAAELMICCEVPSMNAYFTNLQ